VWQLPLWCFFACNQEVIMIQRFAIIFGAIFLLVGIVSFVPGVTVFDLVDHGRLLGLFAVDGIHNGVHILTGAVAIVAGIGGVFASRMYFRIFGVIYGLVALLGFRYGNAALFGIMANSLPDAALHLLVAAVALFLGFGQLPARFERPGDEGSHHPA
jgi:hypothetical protein